MPETPQEWYERTRAAIDADGYREGDLQQWGSWPWTGALYARPTGMLQLRGTFLSHWGDLLPPVPAAQFRADQLLVAAEVARRVGGSAAAE